MPDVPASFRQDWIRLWNLAERLTTAHPRSRLFSEPEHPSTIFGFAGLFLDSPYEPGRVSDYPNGPQNAFAFASTGGDGVHFCALFGPADSPTTTVVLCVPLADEPNHVVGTSLPEFLALGCLTGYNLDDLAYHGPYALPDRPEIPEESARAFLLRALTEEFGLAPWPDVVSRHAELQNQYGHDIEWSPYPD
ncbi:hypothetical protein [Kribbella lupini]|uniref:SUKH-4 immunity protein of toxin-antitoxin system n=1 Tax=Kribbella lupini TaxID=291602 RepID=A0ABN2BZG3_9ACTN